MNHRTLPDRIVFAVACLTFSPAAFAAEVVWRNTTVTAPAVTTAVTYRSAFWPPPYVVMNTKCGLGTDGEFQIAKRRPLDGSADGITVNGSVPAGSGHDDCVYAVAPRSGGE